MKAKTSLFCQKIEICILETWGDMWYAGLNGIEVLDKDLQVMKLTVDNIDAKPWDMNSVPGYSGDNWILDNLVNGINNTS